MKTNVKFAVIGKVLDDTTGVMFNSTVASGLEGNFTDMRDRLMGLVSGTQPFNNVPAAFKLLLENRGLMVDGLYQNKIETYLTEGATIQVTHRRHRITKQWVALTQPEQYVVHHIKSSDFNGNILCASLKEAPRG